MKLSISLILFIIGLVLFMLAALNIPSSRVSLGWLGAFCFGLGLLIQ
jgi:hypothetical protein